MPEFDAVNVYDTSTLALLFSITDPAIVRPTGVALRPQNLTLAINIDIKPGSFPNGINRKSKGVIPVAILSTENFDASSIAPSTVAFGSNGAGIAHAAWHIDDVNADGFQTCYFTSRPPRPGLPAETRLPLSLARCSADRPSKESIRLGQSRAGNPCGDLYEWRGGEEIHLQRQT